MKCKNPWVGIWGLILAMFALSVQYAGASTEPRVSGSYLVLQDRASDSKLQIQMRIHLVNHGASDLSIQKITLWDLSHPDQRGMKACAIFLRAHGSVETVQEFIVPRSDYQMWQRGSRPRLVLQIAVPGGAKSSTVVRLDRISVREGK